MNDSNVSTPKIYEEKVELRDFLINVFRYKWLVLLVTVMVAGIAVSVILPMPLVYTSTTTVLLEPKTVNVVSIEEVYEDAKGRKSEVQMTSAEVAGSRKIITEVVDKLSLSTHPVLTANLRKGIWYKQILERFKKKPESAPSDAVRKEQLIEQIKNTINVSPVSRSNLIAIEVQTIDPQLSADIANTLSEVFIENEKENRAKLVKDASDWLFQRLKELKDQLLQSEEKLRDFVNSQPLSFFQTQTAFVENPVIQRLGEVESDLQRKISELEKRYGPEHPNMIAAQADLAAASANLQKEITKVTKGIVTDVGRTSERKSRGTQSDVGLDVASADSQFVSLEREVVTNRQLYNLFLGRAKETRLLSELANETARVIDPAAPSLRPSGPKKALYILISVFAGVFLGVLAALTLNYFDNAVTTASDIEVRIGIPVLSVIPLLSQSMLSRTSLKLELEGLGENGTGFSESILSLRTGVQLTNLDQSQHTLLVTSAVEQEGKTTIALNLAASLSRLESKVVVVDCDLRRPTLGDKFGLNRSAKGLSDLLLATADHDSCIHTIPEYERLFVLPAGTKAPNPLDLLSSKRFADILKELEGIYDYVLLDSAPVVQVSDTLVIAKYADSTLLIVRANKTPYQLTGIAVNKLRQAGADKINAVLNQVDIKKMQKYGRYGYGNYDATHVGYGYGAT